MEQKTPLYERHEAAKGKIVPFAGYLLPVQYPTGVIAEHMAVRERCGLFDVSHMGEVILKGPDALKNLQNLLTNDFTNMRPGRVRYSPMCTGRGGVVDDLIVYMLDEGKYLVVVNAANRHKDVQWMKEHLCGDVQFSDISDGVAQLALQGPRARDILKKVMDEGLIPEKYYTFTERAKVGGIECLVSQTGYTGEHGYELYCAPQDAGKLWDLLLGAGKDEGLIPCGLGARDTLRLEAAMPLYGHEMDDEVSPLETGLSFAVKLGKEDFIGKSAILRRGEPAIERVGLQVTGRGIARGSEDVYIGERKIGRTTSGTHCPYLGEAVAMALVDKGSLPQGACCEIDVRGRRIEAKAVPLPFYKNK